MKFFLLMLFAFLAPLVSMAVQLSPPQLTKISDLEYTNSDGTSANDRAGFAHSEKYVFLYRTTMPPFDMNRLQLFEAATGKEVFSVSCRDCSGRIRDVYVSEKQGRVIVVNEAYWGMGRGSVIVYDLKTQALLFRVLPYIRSSESIGSPAVAVDEEHQRVLVNAWSHWDGARMIVLSLTDGKTTELPYRYGEEFIIAASGRILKLTRLEGGTKPGEGVKYEVTDLDRGARLGDFVYFGELMSDKMDFEKEPVIFGLYNDHLLTVQHDFIDNSLSGPLHPQTSFDLRKDDSGQYPFGKIFGNMLPIPLAPNLGLIANGFGTVALFDFATEEIFDQQTLPYNYGSLVARSATTLRFLIPPWSESDGHGELIHHDASLADLNLKTKEIQMTPACGTGRLSPQGGYLFCFGYDRELKASWWKVN